MTKITSFDLTPFYRNTVGIDRLFDRITSQIDTGGSNYPPYDIVRTQEDHYEIRIAAAGFRQGDITVEYHEGQLTVVAQGVPALEGQEYLHHGISRRGFTRSFTVADYVEVLGAVMRDGVLIISLERRVPEAMRPRRIEIAYHNDIDQ